MRKEGVTLTVEGLEIHGEIYAPSSTDTLHPALCICHGIPAGVPDPTDRGYPLLAERFCAEGFTTLIFNFRGARISQENFDILGWTRDLEAAIDYLSSHAGADTHRLSVMGFSGGAVAIYVASCDRRISSLVACACPADFGLLVKPEGVTEFLQRAREIGGIEEEAAQGDRGERPFSAPQISF